MVIKNNDHLAVLLTHNSALMTGNELFASQKELLNGSRL